MRLASLSLAIVVVASGACGGKTEEQGLAPGSGMNTPTNAEASGVGCDRACDRMYATCTESPRGRETCASSCASDFDERAARIYGACVGALSCESIERGLSMDFGPIGECWAKAHGAQGH